MTHPRFRPLADVGVLVSGGGSGIGRAVALGAASAGARVVVADVAGGRQSEVADEILRAGGEATAIEIDVTDEAAVSAGVRAAGTWAGRLDAVFNPAGVLCQGSIETCAREDWDAALAVHLLGHTRVMAAALDVFTEQGSGTMIAVGSGAAIDSIGPLLAYSTAKSAVVGLARSVARRLSSSITINAISPTAYTPMSRDAPPDESSAIPARYRRRSAEDIVPLLCWLMSQEAVNCRGRYFMVSGGHTIEFIGPRPRKLVRVPADASAWDVQADLIWIVGRPALREIGTRPTRDYVAHAQGHVFARASASVMELSQPPHPPRQPRPPRLRVVGTVASGVAEALAGSPGAGPWPPPTTDPPDGCFVFTENPACSADSRDGLVEDVSHAGSHAARLVTDCFLSVQQEARDAVSAGGGTLVVVLPPTGRPAESLCAEVMRAGVIGMCRSATSTLAEKGVRIHVVFAPATPADTAAFVAVCKGLVAVGDRLPSGGLYSVDDGHLVSWTHETPAWQHFDVPELSDRWFSGMSATMHTVRS